MSENMENTPIFNKNETVDSSGIQDNLSRDVNQKLVIKSPIQQSKVIINKPCNALLNLKTYDSSTSSSDDGEYETEENQINSVTIHDDDSSTDSDAETGASKNGVPIKKKLTASELLGEIDELPLANLEINDDNLDETEFLHIGNIENIIMSVVTVESFPNIPVYDLNTLLFFEDKQSKKRRLGVIADVIGPVNAPLYCFKFNNVTDIVNFGIEKGDKIFSVPKANYTNYVFVKQLMQVKGSDASWLNDTEIPPGMAEESSDEDSSSDLPHQPLKRKHGGFKKFQRFERYMNHRNNINTQIMRSPNVNDLPVTFPTWWSNDYYYNNPGGSSQ